MLLAGFVAPPAMLMTCSLIITFQGGNCTHTAQNNMENTSNYLNQSKIVTQPRHAFLQSCTLPMQHELASLTFQILFECIKSVLGLHPLSG
jgi:hypothetical protein